MAVSKKTLPTKQTNHPSSTLHPPYLQMIGEAISSLKDRTGSSQPAIAKFIEDQYKSVLPPNFRKTLSLQLKKFVKSEKLVKVKNSYKISQSKILEIVSSTIKASKKKIEVETVAINREEKKKKPIQLVKTPEALKKNSKAKKEVKQSNQSVSGSKMKRLSQVKTPEAMKKKKASTPAKTKTSKSVKSLNPATKKARA